MNTKPKTFDPIAFKDTTRQRCDSAADAWNWWLPQLSRWLGPATEMMQDMAHVGLNVAKRRWKPETAQQNQHEYHFIPCKGAINMLDDISRFHGHAITAIVLISMACAATVAHADSAEEKIARAMTAAPSDIADGATVMDVDGTILREGTNRWVCLPGIGLIPGDRHPMCNDAVWMKWMAAAASGSAFSTDVVGVSYMLAGDAMVNNDNPMATDPNDGGVWVQDGPHIMMLFPDMDVLAELPRNPFVGGPYVMWDKTPLAHVMLPFEAKEPSK